MSTGKSCITCPSYLGSHDATVYFGKSIGVPVCARFGNPMWREGMTRADGVALTQHLAEKCSKYGAPRPSRPDFGQATFQVMLPDPQTLGSNNARDNQSAVASCLSCEHFVPAQSAFPETGWRASVCSAQGRLLLGNRLTLEARNCDDRSLGAPRGSTGGMTFLPEYESGFGQYDPVKDRESKGAHLAPLDYLRDNGTDREVSPEDKVAGILGWRKITDSVTNNFTHLPIFDPDFFADDERIKIPFSGDDEHPEDYIDYGQLVYKVAVLWMELDETPALWGMAGVGKTELGRHMAWLMGIPFERFSITGSTEIEDLAGSKEYTEGTGTWFRMGRLARAWTKPNVLTVDEPNTGRPEVFQYMRPMFDNSKQLIQDQDDGRRLDRNAYSFPLIAMNPAWDMLNVGANQISDADANRLMHMYLELPPPELESQIIKDRCAHDGWEIPKETLKFVMRIAEDIRNQSGSTGTLSITWGIRPQIKVARSLRWFDPRTAYRMASADFLEPEQQQIMLDIVEAHSA